MFKLFLVVTLVVATLAGPTAAPAPTNPPGANCGTGTCKECQSRTGCAWYNIKITGGDGGCHPTSSPPNPDTYEKITTCPTCQAASCGACIQQGCSWFDVKSHTLQGQCDSTGAGTGTMTEYKKASDCVGLCGASACTECQAQYETAANTTKCTWAEVKLLGTNGRCTLKADIPVTHEAEDICNSASQLTVSLAAVALSVLVALQ